MLDAADIADALRRHSLNIRFSGTYLAFREITGLGICRVFSTRYVTRCIHSAAVYINFNTFNAWNKSNVPQQSQEVTDCWHYLSSPSALAVMHIMRVGLFKFYLPFSAMASQPKKSRRLCVSTGIRLFSWRNAQHCKGIRKIDTACLVSRHSGICILRRTNF